MTLNTNKFPKYYMLLFTQEYNNNLINCVSDKIVKIKEQCFKSVKSHGLLKELHFIARLG